MFRDLGRVHIVSFAVGIVGLIVGIVGIVLAIVFGTAQTTCTTPVTPTCPVITAQACNTNLFGISTTVNNMKWDDAYNNPNGAEYKNAVNNITSTLTDSLNAGLNNQSSSSSFLRILAATGPTSNNVKVEITRLDKDGNGFVIATGNGAISAAVPIENMPNATNVANVITSDKNAYSNSTATPQVCPTCSECQVCTTPTYECPTCTPSPADCPTPTPTIGSTSSTPKPQTSSPVPSTTTPTTTTPTTTTPTTTTPTTTTPTTTTPTTTSPTTTSPTTTSPSTTTPTTTTPSTTTPSTTTPTTTTPTTTTVTTPTTSTATTTTPTTTTTTPPVQSTSTVALPTTPGTTTVPPTIGPNQCYYQSNIAIAVELTNDNSPIDLKMQSFIYNTLLFYPGNPYQLGKRGSNMTELALVPYPTYTEIGSIMGYGAATTSQEIFGLFNSSLTGFAGPDPEIYEALNFISNLTYDGNPGYVIIMGKNGSSVIKSMPSSELLQTRRFTVITIGYQSNDDFSLLASNPGLSFIINQDSDELVVARQIGNILNTSYCVPSSPSPGYITSSTLTVVTSKSTPGPTISTVTTTLPPSSSSPVPVPSSSPKPVPPSSIGTSSTSQGSLSSSSAPSTSGPSTSIAPNPTGSSSSTSSVPTPSGSQSTSPQFSSQTTPSISTQTSSTAQFTSTSAQLTSSTVPAGTTGTTLPTTAPPTKAPGECYYQSNVAVAFELATSTEDIDLQIQNFITDDLFFYQGAPYDLGNITAGKTELSLVPYPNDDALAKVMAYGFASNPGQIGGVMEIFQQTAQQTPIISDAFKYIPLNQRTGAPGFVILVGNSDASAPAAVASAKNLQALGFKIITVAYKSAGSFVALSSDPSYNFQIHQDADKQSVAKAIGDILYAYACTTTVAPSSTVTVPQVSTSSPASKASTASSAPTTTVTNPTVASTSIFQSSSTVSYTTTSGPTPTTCVCTTIEPGSTSPGYSTSTYATTMGSSSFSTVSTPSMTSGSTPGASSSLSTQPSTPGGSTASSQSPGPSSSSPSPQTSTVRASTSSPSQQSSCSPTYTTATVPSGSTPSATQSTSPVSSSTGTVPSTVPTSSGSTTSQICPNQQTVFDGSVGVIFELLPASAQQATINAFVENILLNSNYYGLAVDNLTNQNRTLATAIPYPSTDKYGVTGYGSARSVNDFKNEVIAFNGAIKPVTKTSNLSDTLLYVATLQSVTPKASLIIVGNNESMIDPLSQTLAGKLNATFTIYTVAVGDGATTKLAPLSSGDGYSFTGNTQQIADQIGRKMATSNPAIYCPPPVPSTSAPITSTVSMSSTASVSTTITSTTRLTTAKPTVGPCQCAGRWVYNGDMAIAFEFINGTDGSKQVTNFISNVLLKNSDAYGLSADVNGNQPSKLTIVPYPDPSHYSDANALPYGSIKEASDIGEFVDIYSNLTSPDTTTPSIDDAFVYIKTLNTANANAKVVLLVASNGSKVTDAMDSANALKASGYTVITVAQTASADVFKPLASGDKYTLQIGVGNDDVAADQIANLLLDLSFVCYDDGSSTPAPTTRCPGTQGTTQPGSTGTTPVASSSSSMGSTFSSGSSSTLAGSSSSSSGSTVSVGSTVPTQSTSQGSSSSMKSTVSQGSTSTQPPASSASTVTSTMGSTVTSASSTQGSSTSGSTSMGSTVSSSTMLTTMRPSVGPCDCQGRWVYNGDMAIAFEFIKDSSGSDKVTNFISNTLLKDPSSYGLSADVNGNQPSKLTIVPYPDPVTYAAANSLPYGYIKNSTMIGTTINQYRIFQSDSNDPSIADALTYIGELTKGPNAKVVLLVASEGNDVINATESANALKASGYTVITVAQTPTSPDVFKPLASGDKYSLQIGAGNDDAVAATIASLLLDISSVCYDDGSNTASPITKCPGSQGTTQAGSTGTTPVADSSSSMGSTVSSGSSSSMGSTVSSGSSSTMGSTVSSGSSTSMGSTVSSGSSTSMGSTVSSGSTSTIAGSSSSSAGSTASVGSTVITQSTSQGSSSSKGSTVSQGSTSTQTAASSASTITSTMGSTVTTAPSTESSSTSGSTVTNTGSTSSPGVSTSTSGSTVTSGSSTSPVPLCASPFKGKIAVVVEMKKDDAEIQLAAAFVKNYLYNSQNYNFADVTQAINVPYGSTDQYGTNILNFGDAKSLTDLQKNLDDLYNNSILTSMPAVADGLNWIANNIDSPAAGSKAIVIVVGYNPDVNEEATYFAKMPLTTAGYQFLSVSVGSGNFESIADKKEWYFQVDQSNGQTIANQISYILCNMSL
ncbi:hypothetical protein L3Y34_017581 [Caenorhabditis briggsae]|uniref:VWFA domain-containing protein n=1 Tax=Caenorhabditis briggsae TaxID=6238 RepID=A0AAE9DJK6_CAEBR|nr:hypothetical protein L3Y34_017581 [Caenorhabditis briggsae]